MRTVPLGPILIFIAFFILIYIGLVIAIILTAFINAVRKNDSSTFSFLRTALIKAVKIIAMTSPI